MPVAFLGIVPVALQKKVHRGGQWGGELWHSWNKSLGFKMMTLLTNCTDGTMQDGATQRPIHVCVP